MSRIRIHFAGGIASNHLISMRVLGKSLTHLQSAIDRAHLDLKHGSIWKYAKMHTSDYEEALFVTGVPEEGGYVLDFLGETPIGRLIVNRISAALSPAIDKAMEGGERQVVNFSDQIETRKRQLASSVFTPSTYKELLNNPPEQISRKYGDRSIVKEFDQIASIVRSSRTSDDSAIEIQTTGDSTNNFTFNKSISERFHLVVAEKMIGEPVIYLAKVISLDHKNMKGKIHNVISKKEASIHFTKKEDFFKVRPYLGDVHPIQIVACPLIEYGAFDPRAGDIYFVDLIQENG